MAESFLSWIDRSFAEVRGSGSITLMSLCNPSDQTGQLQVGMVDPTTVIVIVGYGDIRGVDAAGAYVGLIAQDPMLTWRGLAGFFLTWCHACDPAGNEMFAWVKETLSQRDVSLLSVWDMPASIHPQRDWFEGERLQYAAFVNPARDIEAMWATPTTKPREGSALVATGPVSTSLANLVLLQDIKRDIPVLTSLRGGRSSWTVRSGNDSALAALAGLPAGSVAPRLQTFSSIADLPATWGVYRASGQQTWSKPVPNLYKSVRGSPTGRRHQQRWPKIEALFLPPGRAARLADITLLADPPFDPRVN